MKIVHQRDDCIGCNACVENTPDYFKMDAELGLALLIDGKRKNKVFVSKAIKADKDRLKESADRCPVNIIKLEE